MELLSSVQSSFRNENFVNGSEKLLTTSIVCTPTPFLQRGGLSLQPKFQKGELDRTSAFYRGLQLSRKI